MIILLLCVFYFLMPNRSRYVKYISFLIDEGTSTMSTSWYTQSRKYLKFDIVSLKHYLLKTVCIKFLVFLDNWSHWFILGLHWKIPNMLTTNSYVAPYVLKGLIFFLLGLPLIILLFLFLLIDRLLIYFRSKFQFPCCHAAVFSSD